MLTVSAFAFLAFHGVAPRSAVTTPRAASPIAVVDPTTIQYAAGVAVVAGGGFVIYKQQSKEGSAVAKASVTKAKSVVTRKNRKWPMVGGSGGPHRMA